MSLTIIDNVLIQEAQETIDGVDYLIETFSTLDEKVADGIYSKSVNDSKYHNVRLTSLSVITGGRVPGFQICRTSKLHGS